VLNDKVQTIKLNMYLIFERFEKGHPKMAFIKNYFLENLGSLTFIEGIPIFEVPTFNTFS